MGNKRHSHGEELSNTLSHGAGILLGIIAGYFLSGRALINPYPYWAAGCVLVYLTGMPVSYISSIRHHGSRPGDRKGLLRKFDHGAIYPHITGTYTPFILSALRYTGGWGWRIPAFAWLSAIADFTLALKRLKEHGDLEILYFVGVGSAIPVVPKLLMDCPSTIGASPASWWLIGGGTSHAMGAIFYLLRKPYIHAVFHLFCLGGNMGYTIAIWLIL